MDNTPHATIDLRTLSAIAAFCSTVNYGFSGVLLEIERHSVTYVATNRTALAVRRIEVPDHAPKNTLTGQWMLPGKLCRAIKVLKTVRKPSFVPAALTAQSDGFLTLQHGRGVISGIVPVDHLMWNWRTRTRTTAADCTTGPFHEHFLFSPENYSLVCKLGHALGLGNPCLSGTGGRGAAVPFTWIDAPETFCLVEVTRRPAAPWCAPEWAAGE